MCISTILNRIVGPRSPRILSSMGLSVNVIWSLAQFSSFITLSSHRRVTLCHCSVAALLDRSVVLGGGARPTGIEGCVRYAEGLLPLLLDFIRRCLNWDSWPGIHGSGLGSGGPRPQVPYSLLLSSFPTLSFPPCLAQNVCLSVWVCQKTVQFDVSVENGICLRFFVLFSISSFT